MLHFYNALTKSYRVKQFMNKSLFRIRLHKEFAYQWGIWRSVVDWTIFLYLFIPAFAILGYNYYRWWQEIPAWIEGTPFFMVIGLIYLICWQGRIRTFLEEADQLFLLQKRNLIFTLKKSTRNFSLVVYSIGVLILVVFLAPFLVKYYSLSMIEILYLSLFFMSLKALILGLQQYLDDIESPWKKGIYTVFVFVMLGVFILSFVTWALKQFFFLLLIISPIQWLIFFMYSSARLNKITTFSKDVYIEKNEKLKYVKRIFVFSEYVEKVPSQKKRSPLFYRNSKRIYQKRNRKKSLQEVFLKVFFRNKAYVFQCLQIVSITTGAILLIPPIWIKLIIFLCFVIFLRIWVKTVYLRIMSNHFIVNIRKDDLIRIQAEQYAVNFISLPIISIVGIILILIIL